MQELNTYEKERLQDMNAAVEDYESEKDSCSDRDLVEQKRIDWEDIAKRVEKSSPGPRIEEPTR